MVTTVLQKGKPLSVWVDQFLNHLGIGSNLQGLVQNENEGFLVKKMMQLFEMVTTEHEIGRWGPSGRGDQCVRLTLWDPEDGPAW